MNTNTTLILKELEAFYKENNASTLCDRTVLDMRREELVNAQKAAKASGTKLSPHSAVIKRYKIALPIVLPEEIFQVLLGHVLGDAAIKMAKAPGTYGACVAFEWGNQAYAIYVYSKLQDYVLSPPRAQVRINGIGNSVTTYCFQTLTHPCFVVLYDLFIVNSVKIVPEGLVSTLLSPAGLATWYIDDGGLVSYKPGDGQTVHFNTHCFTPEVVLKLASEINERYKLDCYIKILPHKKNQPVIVVPSTSYARFHAIVAPFVDVSIAYKVPVRT